VFNCDQQNYNRQFVLVMEGPFDAIALDGVAVLGSEPNQRQKEMIDNLQRKVIVVSDRDKAGKLLIERAIDYGWSVAFPEWEPGIKDVGDAIIKYGKILTMKSILATIENSKVKIKLKENAWLNK
jgi:DNA primase